MKINSIILFCLFFLQILAPQSSIEQAENLYLGKNYSESIAAYKMAGETYPNKLNTIRFNIGVCYLEMDSIDLAIHYFRLANTASDSKLASQAYNNLGAFLADRNELEKAAIVLKESLRKNHQNEEARRNLELLLAKQNSKSDKKDNKPPKNIAQNLSLDPINENTPENDEEDPAEKLIRLMERLNIKRPKSMEKGTGTSVKDTISMTQAQKLLRQMDDKEIQYLQQLRKSASPSGKTGKADW